MALCKHCGKPFDWSKLNDRWVPLMPSGTEGELPRTHIDNAGVLRTLHNVVCENNDYVTITPLQTPIRVLDLPVKKRKNKS